MYTCIASQLYFWNHKQFKVTIIKASVKRFSSRAAPVLRLNNIALEDELTSRIDLLGELCACIINWNSSPGLWEGEDLAAETFFQKEEPRWVAWITWGPAPPSARCGAWRASWALDGAFWKAAVTRRGATILCVQGCPHAHDKGLWFWCEKLRSYNPNASQMQVLGKEMGVSFSWKEAGLTHT